MSFQVPTTTAAANTGFSFGLATSTAQTAGTTSGVTKPPSFTFGATGGGDAGGGFSNQQAPPAAAATQNFSFGTPSTTAATASVPSLAPKTAAITPLGQANAATTSTAGAFTNLSTATKTTDSTAVANVPHMTFNQLEEHINKWTRELEEQEKVFTDQATQINAWDKILINNNRKIMDLNEAVQKVKADQQTLEQELEFIATQHKELEDSIVPLQKEFTKIPQVDVERSQTYLLVENLDTQLKQMSEDLKEIIENLNETNRGQDNTDPIIQIGRILNAHMGSLQWIESATSNISNKLDELTNMHESFKRDSERSFRSAYYK